MAAGNRRVGLIGLVAVGVLCLVGVLIYNVFVRGQAEDGVARSETPAATAEANSEESTPESTAQEALQTATPAPTNTPEPATEPTEPPPPSPTNTPMPTPTATRAQPEISTIQRVVTVEVPRVGELLSNGGFEDGFSADGVGRGWQNFRTDAVVVNFAPETEAPYLSGGAHAQRMSIDKASQPDRYAGIFQTLPVVPNETYTLTLRGQIRSGFGDVEASSYGYRLQYALDQSGGQNWLDVPQSDWVELPWPEQLIGNADVSFSEFTTQFVPITDTVTLFVRGWNKWPDQTLAEYSLDGLSVVGPDPTNVETIVETVTIAEAPVASAAGETAPPGGESSSDSLLPVTGVVNQAGPGPAGLRWAAGLVIVLLLLSALYRTKSG